MGASALGPCVLDCSGPWFFIGGIFSWGSHLPSLLHHLFCKFTNINLFLCIWIYFLICVKISFTTFTLSQIQTGIVSFFPSEKGSASNANASILKLHALGTAKDIGVGLLVVCPGAWPPCACCDYFEVPREDCYLYSLLCHFIFFGTHNNPDISWETKWFWSVVRTLSPLSFFSFLFFFQHPSGLDRVRTAIVRSYSLKVAELRWEFCEGSGRRYWLQVGHSIHRSAVAIRMKPWWLKWCQNFSAVITFFWQKLIMWENKIIQNHLIDISNT